MRGWVVVLGFLLVGCGGSIAEGGGTTSAPAASASDCLFRVTFASQSVLFDVTQPNSDCESIRGQLNATEISVGGLATYADGVTIAPGTSPACSKDGLFGQASAVFVDHGDTAGANSFCGGFTGHAPTP